MQYTAKANLWQENRESDTKESPHPVLPADSEPYPRESVEIKDKNHVAVKRSYDKLDEVCIGMETVTDKIRDTQVSRSIPCTLGKNTRHTTYNVEVWEHAK